MLNNDLNDYYEKASEKGKDEPIGIVLSLSTIESKKPEGSEKYKFVTYRDFFNKVKENIWNYLEKANQKYIPFLLDYFYNIENLERGENMDQEFLKFLRDHEGLFLEFASKMKEFRRNLRDIVQGVSQSVKEKIEKSKNVKTWVARDLPKLFDIAVVDYYPNNDVDVALDSRLTLKGWDFTLFIRSDKSNPEKLDNYIKQVKQLGLDGEILDNGRFKFDKTFEFDKDTEEISNFIADIINNLH